MKMKKRLTKIIIPLSIRKLLTDLSVISIIKILYDERNNVLPIHIPLTDVNTCIDEKNEYYSQAFVDSPKGKDIYSPCKKVPEYLFVSSLIDGKFIAGSVVGDDDGSLVLEVVDINEKSIVELFSWITPESVIDFGVFSLNLKSGVAYCNNKKTRFIPGSKYYSMLRCLMESASHSLTFDEIDDLKSTKSKNTNKGYDSKIYAVNAAKYLRKKLGMIDGVGSLLHIDKGSGFILEPNQI